MERADADASAQQASLGKGELPLTVSQAKSRRETLGNDKAVALQG